MAVNDKVKKEKLVTSPTIIPKGLHLPVSVPADKIPGKIGRMHGDKIVKSPVKNANANSTAMRSLLIGGDSLIYHRCGVIARIDL
jgi:hypothetical protein